MPRRIIRTMLAATLGVALVSPPAASTELDQLAAIVEAWLASPHADYHSPSFTHWNEDGAVPATCAACHSQPGFLDYLGADGGPAGSVEGPAAINAPVGCAVCHVSEAHALDAVPFPSGVVVEGLGASATCTVCHQGRASGDTVAAATAGLDADAVSADLRFVNVHYGVAAAVIRGAQVRGGFHYPDRAYAGRFEHAPGVRTCVECHSPHTTRVDTASCATCHDGASDIRAIRLGRTDYDGDGDVSGGVRAEILGLHALLYRGIRAYAAEVAGTPIVYVDRFPYFFADPDGDGAIAPEEAVMPNRYQSWTPRLLEAAYNYQVAAKDPGGYVHNPDYLLQLLHDSVQDLATTVDLDTQTLRRP
ncbi:polyheme membrane-associated cytochrome C [Salinarimonas sp.]|uniref:polyheme membrane-associated cytochrome C n=1 Tax=Salinarimonas sp. TaxID=2766526 RepID=UPI0032D8F22A